MKYLTLIFLCLSTLLTSSFTRSNEGKQCKSLSFSIDSAGKLFINDVLFTNQSTIKESIDEIMGTTSKTRIYRPNIFNQGYVKRSTWTYSNCGIQALFHNPRKRNSYARLANGFILYLAPSAEEKILESFKGELTLMGIKMNAGTAFNQIYNDQRFAKLIDKSIYQDPDDYDGPYMRMETGTGWIFLNFNGKGYTLTTIEISGFSNS